MVVKDGKITIAFDFHWGQDPGTWYYFFDTLITSTSDMFTLGRHATYFVTFDLEGNRLDFHSVKLYAYDSWDYLYFGPLPFGNLKGTRGNFLVDEDDNIHIFTSGDFFGKDSLHKAYIIVDGDTNRKYPLNIKTLNGEAFTTSMYFKMDSDWNLIGSRFLIDSISGWYPDGTRRTYIEFKNTTIVGGEIFANCIFYNDDYNFTPNTLPVRVYLDSVHYLRIDNTIDWQTMPCLLKLNRDGEIVWTQQLYNEPTRPIPNNYMEMGSVVTDEENVYAFYKPSWVGLTRFYIDSTHSTSIPNGNLSYCLVVAYNRNTGSPVNYYVVDTVNKNHSQNSLAVLGDELLLNVCFDLLKKTELCKINKYTKEVTWSSPIQYNFLIECKNMSANDHGWIFRGEVGDQPRVYDSIFLGNNQEASVMTFFYDSALDLHRPRPCPAVDSLWCNGIIGHTVTLSWDTRSDHPGYELAYIPEDGNWDDAIIIETTDTTLVVALSDDGCHLFRVRGLCDGNRVAHSPWSDAITVCPQVGINGVEGFSAISLSPNPTDGTVQILGLQDEMITVEVLDMKGQQVMAVDKSTIFNVSSLSSGTYIVRVKTRHDNNTNATPPQKPVTYLKLVKK